MQVKHIKTVPTLWNGKPPAWLCHADHERTKFLKDINPEHLIFVMDISDERLLLSESRVCCIS